MSGSKFQIGNVVYRAWSSYNAQWEKCADCGGTGEVKVVTAKEEYQAPCPYCGMEVYGFHGVRGHVQVYAHRAYVERLTIGQVTVQARKDEYKVEYMCEETGVGSGTIHSEERLFATREEALADAERQVEENKKEKEKQAAGRVANGKKAKPRKKKDA